MQADILLEHLRSRRSMAGDWLSRLEPRKRLELEFHDKHRDRSGSSGQLEQDTYEKLYGNKKYYSVTTLSTEYVTSWISRHASGKVFLDYACGNGFNAIAAARAGARVSLGLDISPISVANASRDAAEAGVAGNTFFFQGDAENTELPPGSVDTIICSGMLHHLDLSYALPELRRILAPGGRILAVEALDYNPAIKLYRQMTPGMRTEWEAAHILDMTDVQFAARFLEIGEVRFWHIASILGAHFPAMLPTLNAIDSVITQLPLVKYLSWIFSFEMLKPGHPND